MDMGERRRWESCGDRSMVDLGGLAVTGTIEKHRDGHGSLEIFLFFLLFFIFFMFFLLSMVHRVGVLETMLLAILSGYFLCCHKS